MTSGAVAASTGSATDPLNAATFRILAECFDSSLQLLLSFGFCGALHAKSDGVQTSLAGTENSAGAKDTDKRNT